MDTNMLVTVATIWGIAVITPGPNFFITIHTAVGSERYLSLFTVLGIVVGTFMWSLSGFLGISLLFKTVPVLYFLLKLFGSMYLIAIGIHLLVKRQPLRKNQKNIEHSARTCFRLGLLTNLLNPKTAIFMTSLFAATIPQSAPLSSGTVYILAICSISAAWYAIVALIFTHHSAKKLFEKQRHLIDKWAGAIFIAFGIRLATSR